MGRLLRLPGIPYLLAQPRKLLKDHMRRLTVQEHEADHAILKAVTSDVSLPLEQRLQAQRLFETALPRDASATRVKNRCVLSGRARAVNKFTRLSRIMFRQLAHQGLLPGYAKASW